MALNTQQGLIQLTMILTFLFLKTVQKLRTGHSQFHPELPLWWIAKHFCWQNFFINSVSVEMDVETLNLNYHFFADDMVFYFVSTNIGTQDCFDSVISTPQEWFNGLKLQLNTRKVRIFEYCLDDSMVCVFQSPMDSKIFDIVNSIAFVIADTLAISKKVTLVCAGCYCNVTAKCITCTVKTYQIIVLQQI